MHWQPLCLLHSCAGERSVRVGVHRIGLISDSCEEEDACDAAPMEISEWGSSHVVRIWWWPGDVSDDILSDALVSM